MFGLNIPGEDVENGGSAEGFAVSYVELKNKFVTGFLLGLGFFTSGVVFAVFLFAVAAYVGMNFQGF